MTLEEEIIKTFKGIAKHSCKPQTILSFRDLWMRMPRVDAHKLATAIIELTLAGELEKLSIDGQSMWGWPVGLERDAQEIEVEKGEAEAHVVKEMLIEPEDWGMSDVDPLRISLRRSGCELGVEPAQSPAKPATELAQASQTRFAAKCPTCGETWWVEGTKKAICHREAETRCGACGTVRTTTRFILEYLQPEESY